MSAVPTAVPTGCPRKDGRSKGRQRYKYGERRRSYLPEGAYHRPGPALKAPGLGMYREGSGLTALSPLAGYSVPAVLG